VFGGLLRRPPVERPPCGSVAPLLRVKPFPPSAPFPSHRDQRGGEDRREHCGLRPPAL